MVTPHRSVTVPALTSQPVDPDPTCSFRFHNTGIVRHGLN